MWQEWIAVAQFVFSIQTWPLELGGTVWVGSKFLGPQHELLVLQLIVQWSVSTSGVWHSRIKASSSLPLSCGATHERNLDPEWTQAEEMPGNAHLVLVVLLRINFYCVEPLSLWDYLLPQLSLSVKMERINWRGEWYYLAGKVKMGIRKMDAPSSTHLSEAGPHFQ